MKMQAMKRLVKSTMLKYPAIFAGYIIYSYLFITLLRYFIMSKANRMSVVEAIEIFDALPFMWLLALTIIKSMEYKAKLQEYENLRMLVQQDIEKKEAQLKTMHEVITGVQHYVNNPLAIISLLIGKLKRLSSSWPEIHHELNVIAQETQSVASVLKKFAESDQYQVEHINSIIGEMTIPSHTQVYEFETHQ